MWLWHEGDAVVVKNEQWHTGCCILYAVVALQLEQTLHCRVRSAYVTPLTPAIASAAPCCLTTWSHFGANGL